MKFKVGDLVKGKMSGCLALVVGCTPLTNQINILLVRYVGESCTIRAYSSNFELLK